MYATGKKELKPVWREDEDGPLNHRGVDPDQDWSSMSNSLALSGR
jgi:hypothetical protein